MEKIAKTTWKEGMAFDAEVNGHKITIDAAEKAGGKNRGPRPKPLLLVALAGCTSMDVVSMLKKMRVDYDSFDVEVFAESTDEHPKHYKKITLKYIFKGKHLSESKIHKAVNLSQERYCGVSHMLNKAAELTHEIVIDEG
ncbi:MAG: OsmC family protein [Bacteroidales bacterium]